MRIDEAGAEAIELRSGSLLIPTVGMAIGLGGALFSGFVAFSLISSQSSRPGESGAWWAVLVPLVFLIVGLTFGALAKRIYVTLRRYGHSEWRTSQFFGLRRHEGTFDAAGSQHVLLHTELRIRHHDKGSSRERISTILLNTRAGEEVVLAKESRSGFGGRQPLLAEAERIAGFLRVPLQRSGYGAPKDVPYS
ncbi:hypothetical protein [Nesterenkonia massiliensis]|uniref:hypothetical protein n=1 Tax=Nesterenkonia massiliensis TaxID=1232429 RepID=UPI0005C9FC93|nr:hypothetical protein [Nesterenkonia massiliensis]